VAADTVELDRVFGEVAGDTDARLRQVRGVYRRLAKVVHPDRHDGAEKAVLAFRRLDTLYARARALIAAGTYGEDRAPTVTIRTKRREYAVSRKVSAGEICDVFECDYGDGFRRAVVKVARHPRDNDLVQVEAATLRRLRKALDDRWLPFLPEPVDLVGWKASGGIVRRGLVLERLDGFYPLDAVVDAYPAGVDPRDMAWVWRRLLAILGAVHEQGVVHGAVVPSSVLIHPGKHGLVLADWSYAVDAGGRPRVVSRRYRSFYPPELADRRPGGGHLYGGADDARPRRRLLVGPAALAPGSDARVLPRLRPPGAVAPRRRMGPPADVRRRPLPAVRAEEVPPVRHAAVVRDSGTPARETERSP
jgi:hypothetical protein